MVSWSPAAGSEVAQQELAVAGGPPARQTDGTASDNGVYGRNRPPGGVLPVSPPRSEATFEHSGFPLFIQVERRSW